MKFLDNLTIKGKLILLIVFFFHWIHSFFLFTGYLLKRRSFKRKNGRSHK